MSHAELEIQVPQKEDGVPLNTLYVRRDGNNVNDKQYADLFTLKSAQEYIRQ